MAYNRTVWTDGNEYGASAFNNIEEGILALESKIGSGDVVATNGYNKKQTKNLAKALKKLRMNQATEFCFMGDSVFYGFDMMNEDGDAVQENCIPDKGLPLEGYTRSPITIYDTFQAVMNKVYDDKIKIKKKIYSGDTIWTAYHRWNASNSDFIIINLGINDAMGGHITDSYHPEIPKGYKGNVELFVEGYRRVIEQELDGGTAVVLMSPTKQTLLIEGTDTDNRTVIDIYEQAVKNLAMEYGCPLLDGNEMTKNFGNDMSIDFCHFTKEGFRAIGYRMASAFIGQSPLFPVMVHDGAYLSVNPHLDNANIVKSAVYENTELSPNFPAMLNSADLGQNVDRITGGLQATVTKDGSVVWSFYCAEDGMVVVPSVYTETQNMGVRMELDFGANQGKWNNYWNSVNADGTIDRSYAEKTTVIIENSDMADHKNQIGKHYGAHMLATASQPVLKITTKGWHSLRISPKFPKAGTRMVNDGRMLFSHIPEDFGDGAISVFGLTFMSLDNYKKLVK